MTRSLSRVVSLSLAAPLLLECSLMNLDDFSEPHCRSNADCLAAQNALGDATRCEYYECRAGSCTPVHGVETCNGEDDDCDGLIDDGLSVLPHEVQGTSRNGAVMAYAVSPSGATAYVVAGSGDPSAVHGIVVSGTVAEPAQPLTYASAAAEGGPTDRPCPVLTKSAGIDAAGCRFDDVALAADEQQLVYATINTAGCGQGQLRIGLAAASAPFRIWLGSSAVGAAPQSNVEIGVDVGDGSCSGASARGESGDAAGARSPAVAALDLSPGATGALVSWLPTSQSDPPHEQPCGSLVDVPVHALGVQVPEQARYVDQRWLVGSDGGTPQLIGRASSLAPPAIVGLSASGSSGRYLAAFPSNEEGAAGIALVLVTVRAQELGFANVGFIEDAEPDLVSLGATSNGDRAAIAWRSGCGATSRLKLVMLTLATRSFSGASPLEFPAATIEYKPQLLHRSDGFTTRKNGGGWFLGWAEKLKRGGGRTQLARVTDDLSTLDAEPTTVTSGGVGLPLLFPDEAGALNQGLLTAGESEAPQVRVFAGWCN